MKARITERVPEDGCRSARTNYNDSFVRGCYYRMSENDPKGAACAVGAFIPDDSRRRIFGYQAAVGELLYAFPELAKNMPLRIDGLTDMQKAHDTADDNEARASTLQWIDENVADAFFS